MNQAQQEEDEGSRQRGFVRGEISYSPVTPPPIKRSSCSALPPSRPLVTEKRMLVDISSFSTDRRRFYGPQSGFFLAAPTEVASSSIVRPSPRHIRRRRDEDESSGVAALPCLFADADGMSLNPVIVSPLKRSAAVRPSHFGGGQSTQNDPTCRSPFFAPIQDPDEEIEALELNDTKRRPSDFRVGLKPSKKPLNSFDETAFIG